MRNCMCADILRVMGYSSFSDHSHISGYSCSHPGEIPMPAMEEDFSWLDFMSKLMQGRHHRIQEGTMLLKATRETNVG